ncbi:MAG: MetQ/NlpA family ABC transporter substrate-binding protein [Chloroflexales bacterium]|nr:MetQ/NlpA family ABC transporter substrate-binding protein [Chloroflexales bacterium]
MRTSTSALLVLLALLAALLSGCAGAPPAASSGPTAAVPAAPSTAPATAAPITAAAPTEAPTTVAQAPLKLKIGATAIPAGQILTFIQETLAPAAGLEIELVEFTDFVQPNLALRDGQIDANLFQHRPYLEDFGKQHSIDLVPVTDQLYLTRLGIYSKKVTSLEEVPEQGVVAIPNDLTNLARALKLLEKHGLITLKPGITGLASVQDIAENPKQLEIIELEALQLPRSLEDTSISIINGPFALQAGLNPSKEALALETQDAGPYGIVLATLAGQDKTPAVQKLVELLRRPEVKQFIDEKYQGAILWIPEHP